MGRHIYRSYGNDGKSEFSTDNAPWLSRGVAAVVAVDRLPGS